MRNALFLAAGLAAACAPAAEQPAASAPAAPDTAAAHVAIEGVNAAYGQAMIAGNAAGVAAVFTEDATVSFFGAPTTRGRAGIEALIAGLFGMERMQAFSAPAASVNSPFSGYATAIGTFNETVDSSGTTVERWGRWVGAYRQGADGKWLASYIMAFPDSARRK